MKQFRNLKTNRRPICKAILLILLFGLPVLLLTGCAGKQEGADSSESEYALSEENSKGSGNAVREENSGDSDRFLRYGNSTESDTLKTAPVGPGNSKPTEEGADNFTDTLKIEDSEKENSTEVIGSKVESTGQTLPAELIGTWTLTEGLPEGLSSYSLTINQDGSTVQNTTDASGASQEFDSTCVTTANGFALVGSEDEMLLDLRLEGNSLVTNSLTNTKSIFIKV